MSWPIIKVVPDLSDMNPVVVKACLQFRAQPAHMFANLDTHYPRVFSFSLESIEKVCLIKGISYLGIFKIAILVNGAFSVDAFLRTMCIKIIVREQ